MKNSKKVFTDVAFILAGIFMAGMGIKGFLFSSHFIDGGATGISMLLSTELKMPLFILLPLVNLPFIILGYRKISPLFAIKSSLAIAGLAICLAVVPFPDVTPDKLLTAIFGGFFIGAGIGLAMRGGAVMDGTEALAVLISQNNHLLKVSDIILILNIIIFLAAAFFLGIDPALYSMITYFAAYKTIDFVLIGVEEYTGVTIVSEKAEQIRQIIIDKIGRGVTVYQGKEGYGKTGDKISEDILFTVVTRLELSGLRSEIDLIDPAAFIAQHTISEIQGGKIKPHAHV